MIRIQSGRLKGKSLPLPDPKLVRPTSSKVRTAILNILQKDIAGSVFWDLCAGSGAMGIEAYSRGASHVLFMDKNPFLIKNLEHWIYQEIPQHARHFSFMAGDASKISQSRGSVLPPAIIFLDPPYQYANWADLLNGVAKNDILGANFLLVLEYHHKDILPWEELPDWGCKILSHHIYGETGVSLLVPSVR